MGSWNNASKLLGNEESLSAHKASNQKDLIMSENIFTSVPPLLHDIQLPSLSLRKKTEQWKRILSVWFSDHRRVELDSSVIKEKKKCTMRGASIVIKKCVWSEVETAALQHLSYLKIGMQFSEHFAFITELWAHFWRSDCAWDLSVRILCAKRKRMFVNPSRGVRFANKANKNMAPGVKKLQFSLCTLAHRWTLSKGMFSIEYLWI